MPSFDFKRTSRKCSASGRAFTSGEEYVSVLIDEEGELVRQDIGLDQWQDPPDGCVGWWRSRVPDLEQGIVYWAPKDVLLAYFQYLIEQGNDLDTAYVMAILLIQKKYLRLLDTESIEGVETMQLSNASTKEKFAVQVIDVNAARVQTIEAELAEKLFTDIAPSDDPPT